MAIGDNRPVKRRPVKRGPVKRARDRNRDSGYTLIELLVVLAILGLITAVAMPSFSTALPGAKLKAAARDLGAELRFARARAIAGNRETLLTVDLTNRRYQVPGAGKSRALPDGIELVMRTAQSEIVGAERASIRFFPDGGSTGGRFTLSQGARGYLVGVDWLTGRITIVNKHDLE